METSNPFDAELSQVVTECFLRGDCADQETSLIAIKRYDGGHGEFGNVFSFVSSKKSSFLSLSFVFLRPPLFSFHTNDDETEKI